MFVIGFYNLSKSSEDDNINNDYLVLKTQTHV